MPKVKRLYRIALTVARRFTSARTHFRCPSIRLYVEKVLLPTLRPGDIVIMDNLGSHKSKAVRQLIRSAGAKLFFLPKILTRPEPHRTVLRQAQAFPSKSCGTNGRSSL
jgi:hypothetical protein